MKTLILPFILSSLFFLGVSCEEIIFENTIDTVYITRPGENILVPTYITVVDTIVIRDTVSTTVIIRDTVVNNIQTTDTVYQVITKDSVIIREVEKIVYHTDTVKVVVYDTIINNVHHYDTIIRNVIVHDTVTVMVYDRTVIYLDTFVTVSYMRPVESIPEEILPHVIEFNNLAHQYGKQPNLGVMIIQYVEELPGEGWSSNSFQISDNSQIVIQLDQRYPAAMHRAGIFRELSRMGLNKKYVTDTNKIMCPLFDPSRTVTKLQLDELFK